MPQTRTLDELQDARQALGRVRAEVEVLWWALSQTAPLEAAPYALKSLERAMAALGAAMVQL